MKREKLRKLRRKHSALLKKPGNVSSRELVSLAKSLGRKKSDRGKHLTWVSTLLNDATPISIPEHPGTLPRYTAGNILDQLEQDIFMFEEELNSGGD